MMRTDEVLTEKIERSQFRLNPSSARGASASLSLSSISEC